MGVHQNQRRAGGGLIVAGSVAQLIAAVLPDSRVFTSSDPSIQLQAIAARPRGWRAQAWGFPLAFTVTSVGFATVAATMPDRRSRTLAVAASAMSFASILLWLPMTAKRLEIGRSIDALVSEEQPPAIDIGGWSFWPYTFATLGSILAMGCALIVSRIHRRAGILAAFASTAALALMRLMHDWPPFLSYLITLAVGFGIAKREPPQRTPDSTVAQQVDG